VQHFVESHVINTGTSPEDAVEMMDRALAADAVVVPGRSHGWVKFESKDAFDSPISYTRTTRDGKKTTVNKGDKVKAVVVVAPDSHGQPMLYSAAYEPVRK